MAGQGQADLFLMLLDENDNPVAGESTDTMFHGSKGFMDINQFDFDGPQIDGKTDEEVISDRDTDDDDDTDTDDDDKKKKKKPKGKKKKKKKKASKVFNFSVDKDYDKASATLLQHYCKNLSRKPVPFNKAVVYCRIVSHAKKAKLIVLKMTFQDVWIIKYGLDVQGGDAGSVPSEKIEFVFSRATMEYTPQSTKGDKAAEPIVQGFNFKTGVKE